MGRNAQRRRAGKRRPRPPRPFLSLVPYIEAHWGLTHKQATEALLGGEVNVNGAVWAYPEVPIDTLQINDQGHYRIMLEGRPDPRPPKALSLGKYRPKDPQ